MGRDVNSGVSRSRSLNFRNRPASVNIGSRPTHIKDKEIKRLDYETTFTSAEPEMPPLTHSESATNITSDVDFLKAREEEEKERKHHHRRLGSGSGHLKRASLPSMGIAGTTRLLAGKFGDAFKMFENNNDSHHQRRRSDSPSRDPINILTPIAGSEATDLSNDREPFDEAEERRVANAAAEYRQRIAAKSGTTGTGGTVKAASIQNRVKSLLSEHDRPAQKTATGYGRFTGSPTPQEESQRQISQPVEVPSRVERHPPHTMSAPASAVDLTKSQRPTALPKPKILRSTMPDATSPAVSEEPPVPHLDDDWEANFSKKYPSLAGLEMVETSISGPKSTATVRM